jgi:uncharacterized DUF497 family protein
MKHGVSFEEATAVFDDPYALHKLDAAPSGVELRFHILGRISIGMVEVVYTQRGDRARLISARRASRHERRFYASTQRQGH